MKTGLIAGTFDPPTLGHLELIRRAAALFGRLYVAVADKPGKGACVFSTEERLSLLQRAIGGLANVEIIILNGLSVDCAQSLQVDALVRGIRNGADLDYEYQLASANRQMTGIETVFLAASPQYVHLSATLIREIASNRRRLHGFVPEIIEEAVFNKLARLE